MRLFLRFLFLALPAILTMAIAGCPQYFGSGGTVTEYYVSTSGSDANGTGTKSDPWRHIQYAVNNAGYGGKPVKINVAAGTYNESLDITKPVFIEGRSMGATTLRSDVRCSSSPCSFIEVETTGSSPTGLTTLRLEHFTIDAGFTQNSSTRDVALRAREASLALNHVLFRQKLDVPPQYGWGIVLDKSTYHIANTEMDMGSSGWQGYADIGIHAKNGSTGTIENFTVSGNITGGIDHVFTFEDSSAEIKNADIRASTIGYADGVRVFWEDPQLEHQVRIADSRFHRPGNAQHSSSYDADGIQIAVFGDIKARIRPRVIVESTEITGFDRALYSGMDNHLLRVRGSDLSGNRWAALETNDYYDHYGTPQIDLGTCTGGNTFGTQASWAIYHTADYDIPARGNSWGVPDPESRIHDHNDAASLGDVKAGPC